MALLFESLSCLDQPYDTSIEDFSGSALSSLLTRCLCISLFISLCVEALVYQDNTQVEVVEQ